MAKAVFCIANTHPQAEKIVAQLNTRLDKNERLK
jgi:hypothetical protein